MALQSPIFLLALIPWAAVLLWLLRGKRPIAAVPYLNLWQSDLASTRQARQWERPPLPICLLLLAALLAIGAAAKPALLGRGKEVTVVLDRGLTMSASGTPRSRYADVTAQLRSILAAHPVTRITLVDLITGERSQLQIDPLTRAVESASRTALNSASLVRPAVWDELRRADQIVILLSDHPADIADARFIQLAPAATLRDVGIQAVAARDGSHPEVMVTLRNLNSPAGKAVLVARSGDAPASRTIDLPATGKQLNYFLDLPKLGDRVEVRLDVQDDVEADKVAWLARESSSPGLEIHAPIPEPLRKMVASYRKTRGGATGADRVFLVARAEDLPAGQPGVVIAPVVNSATQSTGNPNVMGPAELQVIPDPITSIVSWPDALLGAGLAVHPPEGWRPLVKIRGRTALALRTEPGRQIWVGFDSPAWPRSIDFVVFWTNVFDSFRDAAQEFASRPIRQLDDGWKRQTAAPSGVQADAWPGLFERSDGTPHAFNAEPFLPDGLGDRAIPRDSPSHPPFTQRQELGRWISLTAIVCLILALFASRGRSARAGKT